MSLANDKISLAQRAIGANALVSSRVLRSGFTNIIQSDTLAFGSGSRGERVVFYGETDPGTDYDSYAQIGDEYIQVTYTSGSPSAIAKWVKESAVGWSKVILGGSNLTSVILSAAGELGRIWGATNATSGIFRGLSVRTRFNVAGTATGDALRVYNVTDVSIANMHGIHSTAQLGDEAVASVGTVTGQAAGVRATIGIGLTNTAPAGGTLAALRVDSYFLSSAAGAATSLIYGCDVGGSYGVDCFLRLGALVNRSTSKNTGSYQYIAGHQTPGNCDASLKVVTPDGTFYIPLYASFS